MPPTHSKKHLAHTAALFAWSWLCSKYRVEAPMPEYYLSEKGRFPKYIHSKRRVRITSQRVKWATYVKKTVGVYANWIPCTLEESWTLQFIHEFTHAIQGDQKRRYSEVETTRNELDFAGQYYPHLSTQLTSIEEPRRMMQRTG